MNDASPPEGHYGVQEASERLTELLSSREAVRLELVARRLVRGRQQPEDLLQEAFVRTLGGQRRWPRSVGAVAFVVQTMRSIAYDWNTEAKRQVVHPPDDDVPSLAATPAEIAEAMSEERFLLQQLQDDPEVHALAEALIAEWDMEELLSLFDGNRTKYETTRRRLRRRLDVRSRTGGTPCPPPPANGRRA